MAAAVGLAAAWLRFRAAADPAPSPSGDATVTVYDEATGEAGEWPDVDWAWWQAANPDVIGWVTVPGTDINHPVCQAHADDPDFYLSHDAFGCYNPLGAVYLDAECEAQGLSSRNAVILGHSRRLTGTVTGFGHVMSYADRAFAEAHSEVLLQTPTERIRLKVRFANVVPGWEPSKRTSFDSDADYRSWYDGEMESADMVLDGTFEATRTVSLVSCSYYTWKSNERTVVTCAADEWAEQAREDPR